MTGLSAKEFEERHYASQIPSARCLLHLRLEGYEALELKRVKDTEGKNRFAERRPDGGDILVISPEIEGGRGIFEVKWRNVEFDAKRKWKYPDIRLGPPYSFRQMKYPLWRVAVVNRDQTGFLQIEGSTIDQWWEEECRNPTVKGETQMNYLCRPSLGTWVPFRDGADADLIEALKDERDQALEERDEAWAVSWAYHERAVAAEGKGQKP